MIIRPLGGLHTSARDMASFLRMLLNQGLRRSPWVVSSGRWSPDAIRFRRDDEPVATSAFVRDEVGRLYFQEDDSCARVAP